MLPSRRKILRLYIANELIINNLSFFEFVKLALALQCLI